ncbi:MAG TPA: hypothetical protein VF603_07415 [Allosphingosinicella sp.]|jgi:hypothetical protein
MEAARETGGGTGGGGTTTGDPLLDALVAKLPASGSDFDLPSRVPWLQMVAMAFQLAYAAKGEIEIKAKGNAAGQATS